MNFIKQLMEIDEFQNQSFKDVDEKLLHLYKVQASRCHELFRFMEKLNNKYGGIDNHVADVWMVRFCATTQPSGRIRPKDYLIEWFMKLVPLQEMEKLEKLYDRMLDAKIKFENDDQQKDNYLKVQRILKRMKDEKLKEASTTPHKHIIWIDDMRSPPASIEANCDIARTYDEAINMLSHHMYTDLYLDHDLGDFSGPEGRERTGYDVLLWLVQRKHDHEHVPTNFHILTANPVGRAKFEGVINRYLRS